MSSIASECIGSPSELLGSFDISQVKGLVAQLIQVKDVSTATGLEVTAGGKVCF